MHFKDMKISKPFINSMYHLSDSFYTTPARFTSRSRRPPLGLSGKPIHSRSYFDLSTTSSASSPLRSSASHAEIQHLSGVVDFDVLYFYGDRLPHAHDHTSQKDEHILSSEELPVMQHLNLISLSTAQARCDIRTRNEGFEMEESAHQSPFSLYTQHPSPMNTAREGKGVKRRGAVFEAPRRNGRLGQRALAGLITGPDDRPALKSHFSNAFPSMSSLSRYSASSFGGGMNTSYLDLNPEASPKWATLYSLSFLDNCNIPPIPRSDSIERGHEPDLVDMSASISFEGISPKMAELPGW